jgi:hypothetical protein
MYVLGQKVLDRTFQEAVLDAIIAHSIHSVSLVIPSASVVKTIYDGTPSGSPARRLMVDFWAYNTVPELGDKERSILKNTDFFMELASVLLTRRGTPDRKSPRLWIPQPKSYHTSQNLEGINQPKKAAGEPEEGTSTRHLSVDEDCDIAWQTVERDDSDALGIGSSSQFDSA